MINKNLFIFFIFVLINVCIVSKSYADEIIYKGSYINGIVVQTISSEFNNVDDAVKFLITQNFYINNKIVLPKNSVIIGYISELKKAEQGRDGYFAVNYYKVILPSGETLPIKGHLLSESSSNIIGGKLTRRSGYRITKFTCR